MDTEIRDAVLDQILVVRATQIPPFSSAYHDISIAMGLRRMSVAGVAAHLSRGTYGNPSTLIRRTRRQLATVAATPPPRRRSSATSSRRSSHA